MAKGSSDGYPTFGATIRQARLKRGWSLEELAKRSGAQKGYISWVETGGVKPPKDWLVLAFAKLLKLNVVELLIQAHIGRAPTVIREELNRRCFGGKRAGTKRSDPFK